MRKTSNTGLLLLLVLLLTSCNKNKKPSAAASIPRPIRFDYFETPDSTRWITYPSGVKLYVVKEGPGPLPTSGAPVTVHYRARIAGGKEFGNTFAEGVPLRFFLGNAVSGFNEGISRLRMGSEAVLIIPPDQGYGAAGFAPNIPPHSTLEYHVSFLGTF